MKNSFLMRLSATLLFLLVPILGVWTFMDADNHGWWFPENLSTFGPAIDGLFDMIMWMVAVTFVLTEVVLAWCIWRFGRNDDSKATFSHGNHKLEMIWTAIPAVLLLVVAFAQMGAWAEIKGRDNMGYDENGELDEDVALRSTTKAPMFELYASQFDWRARYPDEEGNFNGLDIVETAFDVYVPVDTRVVFHLKSRDVLHSFFVPVFRLKQDAVPGMTIPVWFEATKVGSYDLICAELCGWGHYKMAGRVHVMEREEYKAKIAELRLANQSNGTDELPQ